MRYLLARLLAVGCIVMGASRAAAQAQGDVLTLAQAADVLSDLLTVKADRTDARVEAMQQFLREIGKTDAYASAPRVAPKEKPIFYNQVAQAAVIFVKGDGARYADPALKTMNGSQLLEELQALQVYNVHLFLHLNRQRAASDSIAMYLESIGEFEHYLKWAHDKFKPSDAAGESKPNSPEQLAAQMADQIDTAHASAWKKAEARGMSQSEFEQKWQEAIKQYSEAVARKVEGMKPLADQLMKSDAPPPPVPTPPSGGSSATNGPPGGTPTLPPPVPSPYTSAMYQSQSASTWNAWNDNYSDVSNHGSWHRR